MDSIIGMLGALIGVALFVCGYFFGVSQTKTEVKPAEMSEEEKALLKAERDMIKADQDAFKTLMNYNADVAYGLSAESPK